MRKRIYRAILTTVIMLSAGLYGCGESSDSVVNEPVVKIEEKTSSEESVEPPEEKTSISSEMAFEKKTTYVYMYDQWNLYTATVLSEETVKIEKWYRGFSDYNTPYKMSNDLGVITQSSDGFRWIGDNKSCFEVIIANDDKLSKTEPTFFSLYDDDVNEIYKKPIEDDGSYGFLYDKWDVYIADRLSESTIKIQRWSRVIADDVTPFVCRGDICIIDENNNDADFKWLDEDKTCFQVTMVDTENIRWTSPETVAFTIGVEQYIIEPPVVTEAVEETTKEVVEEVTPEVEEEKAEKSTKETGGVDPDLKAFLDSYEAFMDEYVDFMKKYMNDPGNALTMLADYTKILEKYEDFTEKIDAYDTDEMSTEDAKYYLEVINRCNQKMLEIY